MKPERFRRVIEVFKQVCDLPPPEVERHLAELDTGLADAVRALVAAERGGSRRLMPVAGGAKLADLDPPRPAPSLTNSRIAQFEVGQPLGSGGMGEVYVGVDTVLRREVALKAIRRDQRMSEAARRRFLREARMLSSLDHVNICRIYDYVPGEEADLLVLELIQGRSLRKALAAGLTRPEALSIAEQVADALAAAHAQGVVHRDLKLSNVMVTAEGTVKILDFGLARPVEWQGDETAVEPAPDSPPPAALPEPDQPTLFHTAAGLFIGTPSAMSPEQLDGRPATAASDMYSFGLLAQELFTGLPPYPSDLDLELLLRLAKRGVTQPVEGLDRDLTSLIERSKAPRAHDRPSARAVVARLRWIRDKPKRRLRRIAVLTLIGVFALAGLKYTFDLRHERSVADQRRSQAEDLIGFMLGDLRAKLTPLGKLEVLDDVGDKALNYFASVPQAELSDDEVFSRTRALTQIGEVRVAQGRLVAAQEAYAEALTLATGLAQRQPENGRYQAGLGAAHFWVGSVHWMREDLDRALLSFRSYLAISQALVQAEPDNLEWLMELSYAHSNVGSVLKAQGKSSEAIEAFRDSLELKRLAVSADSTNVTWTRDLANTHSWLGDALASEGDLVGALREHRQHQAILLQLLAADPDHADLLKRTADSYEKLGVIQEHLGRFAGARENYSRYEASFQELVARDPANDVWRSSLAIAQRRLGGVLLLEGRVHEARSSLQSACTASRELWAKDPTHETLAVELGMCLARQSLATLHLGALGEAEALASEAVARSTGALEANPAGAKLIELDALAHLALGDVFRAQSRAQEAQAAFQRALAVIESGSGHLGGSLPAAHLRAEALVRLARPDEAAPILRRLEEKGYRRHQ